MSDPFLSALIETFSPDDGPPSAVRPTIESALRLLVADIRSLGEPPAQLLVALAYADAALGEASKAPRQSILDIARIYGRIGMNPIPEYEDAKNMPCDPYCTRCTTYPACKCGHAQGAETSP